jgi:hypothetical protein
MAASTFLSFLCFRVLHTRRRDRTIITTPPTPAPTPMPAFVPVERPEFPGNTLYWTAKTMFTTADVGTWEGVGTSNVVLAAPIEAVVLPAAESSVLLICTNSGVVLVTGTAGGTRLLLKEL